MASVIVRAARSARYRARIAGRRTGARVRHLMHRTSGALGDRRRSPAGPAAVVTEPEFSPRAMARAGLPGYFAAGARRYATCTGVLWTRPDRLVTAFLLGSALVTYDFDGRTDRVRIRHLSTTVDRHRIGWPESLAGAPDGSWLAMPDSNSARLLVLRVDRESGIPDPEPVAECAVPGDQNLHGVAVAPDGRSLLYTCVGNRAVGGSLRHVPVAATGGTVHLGPVTGIPDPEPRLRPKAVAYSPDGRFVAVGYGPNVTVDPVLDHPPARVDVHRHDPATGLGELVGRTPDHWLGRGSVECVAWTPDGRRLVATDQVGDQALIVDVDPRSGAVAGLANRIGWAAGGLSFPHGCAVSPDGRWLAITNYGDGTLRLFRLAT